MKQILLSIQQRLTELTGLRYIDRDWGQLQYEQPPVQFPCALIDVANIDFTQQGRGAQLGEATVTVTIANINPVPSSALAPDPAASYETIDLMEEVHQKLQSCNGHNKHCLLTGIRTTISLIQMRITERVVIL